MSDLSTEAKVVAGSYWGVMHTSRLSFDRPWIIHPKMRKGLDDLVTAGLLTMTPRNNLPDCPLDWTPTEKMKTDNPKISIAFVKAHTFPITTE